MSSEPSLRPAEGRTLAALALLALASLAGCGNYSNDDIEFIAAVPRRGDLESKIRDEAQAAGTTGALRQGLVLLGGRSEMYDGTRKASADFNAGLMNVLGLFEAVLKHPPSTRRGALYREWGPVPLENQPAFAFRVVIERKRDEATGEPADEFEYRLQVRRRVPRVFEWFDVIHGTYKASGGIRRGRGTIVLSTAEARAAGMSLGALENVDLLAIDYGTDGDPLFVSLELQARSLTGPVLARYDYSQRTDGDAFGSGSMRFEISQNVVGGALSPPEVFVVTSRWLADGSGRADATVTSGEIVGAQHIECWDAGFSVTYVSKSWDQLELGSAEACAFGAELP